MSDSQTAQLLALARKHHFAGRLQQAQALYRQILAQEPDYAPALDLLGVLAQQYGQGPIALELIGRAAELHPEVPEYHNNLGTALASQGRFEEAVAAFGKSIALRPRAAGAYLNLGRALTQLQQLDGAVQAFRDATRLEPGNAPALLALADALMPLARLQDAIEAYSAALKLLPAAGVDEATVQNNLSLALRRHGDLEGALAANQRAVELAPAKAEAMANLGSLLLTIGRVEQSLQTSRRALELDPALPDAHNNLGLALNRQWRLDESIAAFQRAVQLSPRDPKYHSNLGSALMDAGEVAQAVRCYDMALQLDPGLARAGSNRVYSLHFHPGYDGQAILREQRAWARRHAAQACPQTLPHLKDPSPLRRLRVGYVSPDLRNHVVGRNILPLLREHDPANFEVYCYSDVTAPDHYTQQFMRHASQWRNTSGLDDAQLAQTVHRDRIDVLVDLTLHMSGTRLLAFAHRPAPVQVTFGGYPAGTGLDAIGYRLTDPYLDPPGLTDAMYVERSVRLPHSFWCYEPYQTETGPVTTPVSALPADRNGFVTFGCLNNNAKVNQQVLARWARILRTVAGSRLLMLSPFGSHREKAARFLVSQGVMPRQIEFAPYQAVAAYLETYHGIDIGLDSLPYNGHTTSLDSFWMGVPVVTQVGTAAVSRAGWSQLSNLGLTELAAFNEEEFVRISTELATDLPRLRALRSSLRARMEESPLMDSPGFARGVESAYRTMWRQWCEINS